MADPVSSRQSNELSTHTLADLPEGVVCDQESCLEITSDQSDPNSLETVCVNPEGQINQPEGLSNEAFSDIQLLESRYLENHPEITLDEMETLFALTDHIDSNGDTFITEIEFLSNFTNPLGTNRDGFMCSDKAAFDANAKSLLESQHLNTTMGFKIWQELGSMLQDDLGYAPEDKSQHVVLQSTCDDAKRSAPSSTTPRDIKEPITESHDSKNLDIIKKKIDSSFKSEDFSKFIADWNVSHANELQEIDPGILGDVIELNDTNFVTLEEQMEMSPEEFEDYMDEIFIPDNAANSTDEDW